MKKFSVAILGAGNRGRVFIGVMQTMPEKFEVTAVSSKATTLESAIASHRIGIAAEKSRLHNSKIIKL